MCAKFAPSFTDVVVRSLKPGLHLDARLPGFGIRVGKTRKTWVVLTGPNTRRSKVTLGHYPDTSLLDARKLARVAMATPAEGRPTINFPEAVEAFLEQARWRASSRKVLQSSLRHFSWKRPIGKITHEDVVTALEAIDGKSARAHALKDIRTFFNWCVPRYISASPCIGLKMEPQPSRDRVLSRDELRRVWKAAEGTGYPFGTIVQLLILTGQRKSEIGSLRWDQVDQALVHLPAGSTKNGRAHTFPLSPTAQAVLPTRSTGFVFTATGSRDVYNGYTFHLKQLQTLSSTSGWTLHDLRRTFATNIAALGTPIHVTEKLLNHVSGTLSGVAAIYNRHNYAEEMRDAVEAWDNALAAFLKAKQEQPAGPDLFLHPDANRRLPTSLKRSPSPSPWSASRTGGKGGVPDPVPRH